MAGIMKTPPVCNYEGSDYQTSFWDEGGRQYEDLAEAIVLEKFLPKGGSVLLELGAGAGRNSPRYKNFDKVVLLDYSKTQLQQAKQRLGDSNRYIFVAADIYKLPFRDELFDCSTMIRTIHHMADARLALTQVDRVLQPGATFILEYANKLNLKAILRYALGKQKWSPFDVEPIEFVSLNFDFHPQFIRDLLTDLKFTIVNIRTVSHFRIGLFKRVFPAKFLAFLDGIAQTTGNLWQLSPSVFVNAQKTGASPKPTGAKIKTEIELFCCPQCLKTALEERSNGLGCTVCGATWGVEDGIYDFRDPIEK